MSQPSVNLTNESYFLLSGPRTALPVLSPLQWENILNLNNTPTVPHTAIQPLLSHEHSLSSPVKTWRSDIEIKRIWRCTSLTGLTESLQCRIIIIIILTSVDSTLLYPSQATWWWWCTTPTYRADSKRLSVEIWFYIWALRNAGIDSAPQCTGVFKSQVQTNTAHLAQSNLSVRLRFTLHFNFIVLMVGTDWLGTVWPPSLCCASFRLINTNSLSHTPTNSRTNQPSNNMVWRL